jgi:hypothetical protein
MDTLMASAEGTVTLKRDTASFDKSKTVRSRGRDAVHFASRRRHGPDVLETRCDECEHRDPQEDERPGQRRLRE